MPASPAMRFSPGRELRSGDHKRGRSLENGMVFKERDDDLALFNEVQSRERDNFLLLSNDDFEDTFVTKLRDFSDHKLGINIAARGESSDFLNTEEEKNDYEWLITPPDTPLFTSLDDEAPQVVLPQRGRSRAQPIAISRSSTMEKSHRSSRGSPSPNRLSPSPQSSITTFQPATRPTTGSRRPSSPSSKASTPPPRASTPTSRRLSTGSTTTRGISPVKTSRENSASPKIRAWQANIPGFSTEAPPNLRTSLADRPASYVRGSSPASRNSRQSQSPTPSRSISSSHSHDRDRFSPRSKGSIASSVDDDVESLPSVIVNGSERSNLRKVGGFRNNKASFSQKPNRTVPSSSAPKRSFDLALRQMDHKRGPQNRFRPLLSSVPSSNFYAGKAWNSSVTTSSNASSDLATSGAHDIEETELNEDDATSGYVKVPDSTVDHGVYVFEKTDSLNMENETHEQFGDFKGDLTVHSQLDGVEILAECDTATSVVSDDVRDGSLEDESLKGTSLCSSCGCRYFNIRPTQEEIKLCENCQKSYSSLTIDERVATIGSFQEKKNVSDEEHESFNTLELEMNTVEIESTEVTQFEQHEGLVKDGKCTHGEPIWNVLSENSLSEPRLEQEEPTQVSLQVVSQPIYSDAGSDQIQHAVNFSDSNADSLVLKKSNSIKALVFKSGNFSASSISYDDLSYVRDSTNSMRSSIGRGSLSASSSVDFGPNMQSDARFNRQLSSKKSEMENYKHHKRSVSSSSGTSGHAFHPSSVGTSTLDSFEVSSVRVGKDLADVASVGPQETPCENNHTCPENEELDNARVEIGSNSELPTFNQTDPDSGEVLLHESLNFEDLEKDDSEEDTSLDLCVERSDVAEVQLSVISEGEFDHTCLSSPASQCNVSQHSEGNIEELEHPCDLTEPGKDLAASATDGDTSNHATGIIEESLVLIKGEEKTKGRSLTLEEATDTILFCSSIVHNLAYEAATLSIQKQTPPHPDPSENNSSWPLIPAIVKGRKEVQTKKINKRSSKSKKNRQKKATTKPPNISNTNTNEESDLAKPCIVYPNNNKEIRRPPELESKCNCSIM